MTMVPCDVSSTATCGPVSDAVVVFALFAGWAGVAAAPSGETVLVFALGESAAFAVAVTIARAAIMPSQSRTMRILLQEWCVWGRSKRASLGVRVRAGQEFATVRARSNRTPFEKAWSTPRARGVGPLPARALKLLYCPAVSSTALASSEEGGHAPV